MSTLLELVSRNTPAVYRDPSFQTSTALNLTHLQRRESAFPQALEPTQALQFRGDFLGLLIKLQIPEPLHHVVSLLNEIRDPLDFTGVLDHLWGYSETEFGKFAAEYRSLSR